MVVHPWDENPITSAQNLAVERLAIVAKEHRIERRARCIKIEDLDASEKRLGHQLQLNLHDLLGLNVILEHALPGHLLPELQRIINATEVQRMPMAAEVGRPGILDRGLHPIY